MASPVAVAFLADLESRWGRLRRLPNSNSLFEVAACARVYLHTLWCTKAAAHSSDFESRSPPAQGFSKLFVLLSGPGFSTLVIPYEDFRGVFANVEPARNGQYKVQVELRREGSDLRIRRAGSFGVEAYFGIDSLVNVVEAKPHVRPMPDFTHPQVQTLLGAIGSKSGLLIWTPLADRSGLDWTLAGQFHLLSHCRKWGLKPLRLVLQQIDVIWLDARHNTISAAFEIEHTTPIYSGLLRFNDVHIDLKLPRRSRCPGGAQVRLRQAG